ncbi:hypothetical protein, partial [Klebsiella pneumoniae]|uniref:hypothetical protein n=1 Tax=Klebsiella pneumoniae TaxID=573 RepID=UPI001953B103
MSMIASSERCGRQIGTRGTHWGVGTQNIHTHLLETMATAYHPHAYPDDLDPRVEALVTEII